MSLLDEIPLAHLNDEKFFALYSTVQELQKSLSSKAEAYSSKTERTKKAGELQSELASLNDQKEFLEERVKQLESLFASRSDFADLYSAISVLQSDQATIAQAQQRIAELQQDIQRLQEEKVRLIVNRDNFGSDKARGVDRFKAALTSKRESVGKLEKDVDEISERIKRIKRIAGFVSLPENSGLNGSSLQSLKASMTSQIAQLEADMLESKRNPDAKLVIYEQQLAIVEKKNALLAIQIERLKLKTPVSMVPREQATKLRNETNLVERNSNETSSLIDTLKKQAVDLETEIHALSAKSSVAPSQADACLVLARSPGTSGLATVLDLLEARLKFLQSNSRRLGGRGR